MSEVKDRYRRQRLPVPLATELEDEFARRARPDPEVRAWRWQAAAVAAMSVVIAVALVRTLSPPDAGTAEQYALSREAPMRTSPAALTARTSVLGQLSVSGLRLPSNTNLAGATSMPVLPPAPPPPATTLRESTTRRKS